ncbi:MAG: MaoC/PaaZ C-terminal domain-containing protein [Pseudomonadota bacterium]
MTDTPHQWQAGHVFALETEPVTTQQLVRYAGASDDYNRIHYDLPFAEASGLGGVIAHGMLTMAFMGRAVTDAIGPAGFVRRLSARFVAPVRPGDVVRVEAKILEARDEAGARHVRADLTARVGGRPVAVGEAELRLPGASA